MTGSGEIPEEGPGEVVLPVGTRLGKYEIVRLLGAGGMGAVYEASHTEIGKRVAVKVLGSAIAAVPGARVRFLREAQLTSKVRHPNIVDVTDMGNEGGQAFLVMEFLEGQDLAQRLAVAKKMPQAELVDIMLPVCSAVSAAHAAGIIHRDLKPQNIFLAQGPHGMQPKVLDFGISKGTDKVSAGTLTGTGAMIGTPFYLAPEQIMDGKSAGSASDEYALGVILYECLTGQRPFESDNLFMVFQAIVNGAPPPPRLLRPDLAPQLERVILRAMNVDPKQRFTSVNQLGRMLLSFASDRARMLWADAFGVDTPEEATALAAWKDGTAAKDKARENNRDQTRPMLEPPPGSAAAAVATWDVGKTPRRPGLTAKVGVVAGAVAALGLGVMLLARRSPSPAPSAAPGAGNAGVHSRPVTSAPPPVPATPAVPKTVPPPPPLPPLPQTFEAVVTVSPESAALELDGEPVGTGHLERTLPIDHHPHVLRASAPGYVAREVEFTDESPPEQLTLPVVSEGPKPAAKRPAAQRPPKHAPTAEPGEPAAPSTLNPNGAPVID
jgi:hypothetical protein